MGTEISLHLESVRAVNALKNGILVVKTDVHIKILCQSQLAIINIF